MAHDQATAQVAAILSTASAFAPARPRAGAGMACAAPPAAPGLDLPEIALFAHLAQLASSGADHRAGGDAPTLLPPDAHGGARPPAAARSRSADSRSTSAYASRHQAAEARRRNRINERLDALRALVPSRGGEKLNTAAFLEAVADHVRSLQVALDAATGGSGGAPLAATSEPGKPPAALTPPAAAWPAGADLAVAMAALQAAARDGAAAAVQAAVTAGATRGLLAAAPTSPPATDAEADPSSCGGLSNLSAGASTGGRATKRARAATPRRAD